MCKFVAASGVAAARSLHRRRPILRSNAMRRQVTVIVAAAGYRQEVLR
jgi:hypothetical protein